jgi:riboflavin synthase
MFTGLIADLGCVTVLEQKPDGVTLRIKTFLADELAQGDSVAVNGVCLTALEPKKDTFDAQAMHETLKRSSLENLQVGSLVNLELALKADGRLGGHIVQGHVDATATVSAIEDQGFSRVLTIELGQGLERYLVQKGSVALNGVSLTISAIYEHGFSVSLIPQTLEHTNLGQAAVGDQVNLEVDVLAKHVERLMEARS